MKFCTKCGSPLVEGNKFCVKCGAPIVSSSQPKQETRPEPEQEATQEIKSQSRPEPRPRPRPVRERRGGQYSRPRPERDIRRTPKGPRKKKSKKPIIILSIIIAILVIAAGVYLALTIAKQSSVSEKSSQLKGYLDKGVKLNDFNDSLYNDALDDEDSLNVFALSTDERNLDNLIKMSEAYIKADALLKQFRGKRDTWNQALESKHIGLNTLSNYKPFNDSLDLLENAMKNNSVQAMDNEAKNVKDNYERYESEITSKLKINKDSYDKAKQVLDDFKSDYDEYIRKAEANGVDSDIKVDNEQDSAMDLINEYIDYLNKGDFDKTTELAPIVSKQLGAYNTAIELAIEQQNEDEGGDYSFNDREISDSYRALPDIDTNLLSGNPFKNAGLSSPKVEFALLVIAKNEPFAEEGYVFGKTLSEYFAKRDWYSPDKSVDDNKLFASWKKSKSTKYKNLKKIQGYIDQYAKKYSWAGETVKKSALKTKDFENAIHEWCD